MKDRQKPPARPEVDHSRAEGRFIGCVAMACAATLAFIALAGPLMLNIIRYRAPLSMIYQTQGIDAVNLLLIAPICVVGGILALRANPRAGRWLAFPPIYLMYAALGYGVGMEWSDPRYTGNNEAFAFLFIFLMIAGLLLLLFSVNRLRDAVAPVLATKGKVVYTVLMGVFLLAFAAMWCAPVVEIMQRGTTAGYDGMRTGFWTVRIIDLGITIPLGFLSLYFLWARPRTGFPIQLLFYGFFVTQITAVLAMAGVQVAGRDPTANPMNVAVFAALAVIVYAGFFFVTGKRRA